VEETGSPAQVPQVGDTLAGNWLVQIGAYRSRDEALQAWSKAQANHTSLLQSFQADVMQVDLGTRGLYQRLRFGPFETREAAVNACESLKAERQDCLVVKR
jgi:cell division septation protein DedD